MPLTVTLTPEMEAQLAAEAARAGVAPERLAAGVAAELTAHEHREEQDVADDPDGPRPDHASEAEEGAGKAEQVADDLAPRDGVPADDELGVQNRMEHLGIPSLEVGTGRGVARHEQWVRKPRGISRRPIGPGVVAWTSSTFTRQLAREAPFLDA